MDNHDVVSDLLREIDRARIRSKHAASHSKFKIGQLVRVTEDKVELVRYLRTFHKNYMEAIMQADTMRGRVMKVVGAEELKDTDGEKRIYVNVEGGSGYLYLFPEDLLRDYRER